MMFALGIDLGIVDKSIYSLVEIKNGKLYILKTQEITQDQQTYILEVYYSKPPKQREILSLGSGTMMYKEMGGITFSKMLKNYNEKCIANVCGILGVEKVDTMVIDFDRGTRHY